MLPFSKFKHLAVILTFWFIPPPHFFLALILRAVFLLFFFPDHIPSSLFPFLTCHNHFFSFYCEFVHPLSKLSCLLLFCVMFFFSFLPLALSLPLSPSLLSLFLGKSNIVTSTSQSRWKSQKLNHLFLSAFSSSPDIFHLKLAAANLDEAVWVGDGGTHVHVLTHMSPSTHRHTRSDSFVDAHACTHTHWHTQNKHKMKEQEAEPRGCLELFPNQHHWEEQERPFVSTLGTLSGLHTKHRHTATYCCYGDPNHQLMNNLFLQKLVLLVTLKPHLHLHSAI